MAIPKCLCLPLAMPVGGKSQLLIAETVIGYFEKTIIEIYTRKI